MLKSKFGNPLIEFVPHGIETAVIGDQTYTYVLLIDMSGQALIRRISQDQSEIVFCQMADPGTDDKSEIADAIAAFWTDYTAGPFTYLFQV
jgi:hypothetical protein